MAENENTIASTANAVKGVLEAVPVYQDMLQPAAKEIGTGLQTVTKLVHVVLAPVSGLVWSYDRIKEFAERRLAEKLKDVPPERITTPDASVAGPALEALKYAGNKPELREMYASLIATAMDSETLKKAHPAFVEIIRQITPDEAKILNVMKSEFVQPKIDIRNAIHSNGTHAAWVVMHHTILPMKAGCQAPELGPNYLVNLQRLGLLELRENYTLSDINGIDPYQKLLGDKEVLRIEQEIKDAGRFMVVLKGTVSLTSLGMQFCEACIE